FFFSSRRRHTRFSRDWSSDVCSSDLAGHAREKVLAECGGRRNDEGVVLPDFCHSRREVLGQVILKARIFASDDLESSVFGQLFRSEERRVGKESSML